MKKSKVIRELSQSDIDWFDGYPFEALEGALRCRTCGNVVRIGEKKNPDGTVTKRAWVPFNFYNKHKNCKENSK